LGSSLGINPLPATHKVCSSNCVYCQYGWTTTAPSSERLKRAPELLDLIEEALHIIVQRAIPVDSITFAGNGEPTLHPDLEALVVGTRRLRDRYLPSASLGILSDATQLYRPAVRRALALLDRRYLKLDAGDEAMWRRINLPLGKTTWAQLIDGIKATPESILQSLFMQGSYDNTQEDHVERWIDLVGTLRPLSVQVYTVDRAPADAGVLEVPKSRLEAIASRLTTRTRIPADVYD